jgi:SPW repeat
VTVLAALRVAGAWVASILGWISALIGAWLFVSAFTLAESQQAAWNVEIAGVVVFFLAIWSDSATEGRRTVV